jgi:membrane protease YdiL (CAAX protease family)
MTVRNEPLANGKPTAPRRPSPAVVPRGCVITAAMAMLRVIAIALILASTLGNYVQFVGGWAVYWPPQWTILLYAAIYQGVCSLMQWGFKAMRWWVPYLFALIASAVPSYLTYAGLFGPNLTLQIGMYPAMLVLLLLVIAGDALPEWVLVE